MKLKCFLLVFLVSFSGVIMAKNTDSIVWNQGTIDITTLKYKSDSCQLTSDFMAFSAPVVICNHNPEGLALYLFEYDSKDNFIKSSNIWIRNNLILENVSDRKFRLLVKALSSNVIDPDIVSENIILKTGREAHKEIMQRKKEFEKAARRVFTNSNTYQTPLYIAHRGYTVDAPENSIPSFIHAGQKGAWAIETDLHFTKDSVVVCIHNENVDSKYNGTGKVSDYTYKELLEMKIDAGNNISQYSDKELRIPTLEQYLNICKTYGCVAFIELKDDASEEVFAAAKKLGMKGRYIVSSLNIDMLAHFRGLSNEMIHHINMKPTSSYLDALVLMGNSSTGFDLRDPSGADKKMIEKCHSLGLKVCFRAVDTAEYAKKCIDGGLDFLPSNTMEKF